MEQLHNSSSEDVTSNKPTENVVKVDCLPIQNAVTTCLLPKNWRLIWTLVTQVLFDGISSFLQGSGPKGKYCYDGKKLRRLRSGDYLEGPVTKFVLTIPNNMALDVEDINHWIILLSVKVVKDISLINKHKTPLKLPALYDLFSSPELRYLNLHNCYLHDESLPTNLIINLLSLELDEVKGNFGEIITHAPFLEVLKISYHDPIGIVKLVDIAKLENLKTLHVPLCMIDDENTKSSSIIFQLGVYLPKLEELKLHFHKCMFLGDVGSTKWVSTVFPCLKTLELISVNFTSSLSRVIGMIWCSPNLQTLKIKAEYNFHLRPMACFSSELENNTMRRLQQLQHVQVFTSLTFSSDEESLTKYLLVSSPLLKKIEIHTPWSMTACRKLSLASTLLMFPRASPSAQVSLITPVCIRKFVWGTRFSPHSSLGHDRDSFVRKPLEIRFQT